MLDFVGCTANLIYIHNSANRFFAVNLGDSKAMHYLKTNDKIEIKQL